MTSCCPPPRMRWSGATGAIARCKRVSTGCGHKSRSGCVLHWICGVKPTPKAGNTPLQHFIVHGLDKPGSSATVSARMTFPQRRCLTNYHVWGYNGSLIYLQFFWPQREQMLHTERFWCGYSDYRSRGGFSLHEDNVDQQALGESAPHQFLSADP